jgi:HEAT repeat protein
MSIRTVCTNCGASHQLRDEIAGQAVRCPLCRELFTAQPQPDRPADNQAEDRFTERPARPAPPAPGPELRPEVELTAEMEASPEVELGPEMEAGPAVATDPGPVLDPDVLFTEKPPAAQAAIKTPAQAKEEPPARKDLPRRKTKRKKKAKGNTALVVGLVVGGVLLIGGGVAGYFIWKARQAPVTLEQFLGQMANDQSMTLDRALDELKGRDGYKRGRAAQWLARAQVDRARQAEVARTLDALVSDRDGTINASAFRALKVWATRDNVATLVHILDDARVGPLSAQAVASMEILAKLPDERGAVAVARYLPNIFSVQSAHRCLREMGPVAQKAVLKYYHHPDGAAFDPVRSLLKDYKTPPAEVVRQSADDLQHDSREYRLRSAAWLALQRPDPALRPQVRKALEGILADGDEPVALAGLKALGVWMTPDSVPALLRLVDAPATTARANTLRRGAMDLLGQLKDERAVPALARRLVYQDDRESAAKALTAVGPPVEKELLAKYVTHPDRAVREAAGRVLDAVGSGARYRVLQALADVQGADEQRRREALRALMTMPVDKGRREEVARVLRPLLEGTSDELTNLAARALGAWGGPEDVPALIQTLSSPAAAVRHGALDALGKLKDSRAVSVVASHLLIGGDRQYASRALIAMGPTVEPSVLTGLQLADVNVVLECCRILEAVGTKASLGPLGTLGRASLAQRNRDVADACQRAVLAINARAGVMPPPQATSPAAGKGSR